MAKHGCGVDGVEKFARGLLDDYQAIKNSIVPLPANGTMEFLKDLYAKSKPQKELWEEEPLSRCWKERSFLEFNANCTKI